jgi:hypothetical protein
MGKRVKGKRKSGPKHPVPTTISTGDFILLPIPKFNKHRF